MERATNLEAMLLGITGDAADPECTTCQSGSGPFVGCFSVAGVAGNSCSNCHYNSEGTRCSFRTKATRKRGARDRK